MPLQKKPASRTKNNKAKQPVRKRSRSRSRKAAKPVPKTVTSAAAKARAAAAAKKRAAVAKSRAAVKSRAAAARARATPAKSRAAAAKSRAAPAKSPAANLKIQTVFRKEKVESKENPKYNQLRTKKAPVCFYAKQGPRDYMEDTYQIMHFNIKGRPGTFYGVFDGHGGKDVSYECVHETRGLFPFLIENIKKANCRNIPQVIKASFLEYDKRLFRKDVNAGSTAIVILYFGNKFYVINLGDSRGMIFTKTECLSVSDDHKPQKPTEKTRIYKAGHFVNPFRIFDQRPAGKRFMVGDIYADRSSDKYYIYLQGKWEQISRDQYSQVRDMTRDGLEDTTRVSNSLALSRALGDFYLKVDHNKKYMGPSAAVSMIPDVTVVDVSAKKFRGQEIYVFLASDGFWDVNRNTIGLRKALANHPTPQKLCKELVDLSYEKGSQDNTTVVLDKIHV